MCLHGANRCGHRRGWPGWVKNKRLLLEMRLTESVVAIKLHRECLRTQWCSEMFSEFRK